MSSILIAGAILLLLSCYSSTVYKPDISYTEAEVNIVFDKKGFRELNGWVWQLGTLVFEYGEDKLGICGWPEEKDTFEEWLYLIYYPETSNYKIRSNIVLD